MLLFSQSFVSIVGRPEMAPLRDVGSKILAALGSGANPPRRPSQDSCREQVDLVSDLSVAREDGQATIKEEWPAIAERSPAKSMRMLSASQS